MVREVVWTLKAKNDLYDILQYWINRNKSKTFSIKLNNLIEEQLNIVAKFPEIGRKTDIKDVRVKVIHKYLLYYEILDDALFVLTIRHTRQNQKDLKLR